MHIKPVGCSGWKIRIRRSGNSAQSKIISARVLRLTHRVIALQATQGVTERFEALVTLFESFGYFFNQFSMRSDVPFKEGSQVVVVEIMVELLKTLALATQMMKQTRLSGRFTHD
jgi:hypothetical protein